MKVLVRLILRSKPVELACETARCRSDQTLNSNC